MTKKIGKYKVGGKDRALSAVDGATISGNLDGIGTLGTSGLVTAGAGVVATTGGVTATAGGLTVTAGQTAFRGTITTGFQPAQATTANSTAAITAANILTGIVQCTPDADREKDTDTAANLISTLGLTANNDSFDFIVINLATDGSSHITLDEGTDVTLVGCMVVSAQDLAENAFTSGVGMFRIRRTSGTEVTIYRIM